jgi:hypothetical protein
MTTLKTFAVVVGFAVAYDEWAVAAAAAAEEKEEEEEENTRRYARRD